jgi:TolB protein
MHAQVPKPIAALAWAAIAIAAGSLTDSARGQDQKKGQAAAAVRSHITISTADGQTQEVILTSSRNLQAPNWSPDGTYLLLNGEGRLWRLPVAGGAIEPVEAGSVTRINNDHGISPDGKSFAISAGQIYLMPAEGGTPRQVTGAVPSYFHGFSPDGKTLAYCARRGENFDLYRIGREGGEERRLTVHPGYDDGPDYSPDGRWIYFNSDRSGNWDIWRIPADGAGPDDSRAERITHDDWEDWFPHPSPDGRSMVFISFPKGTKGHPANQNVVLRRMAMPRAEAGAQAVDPQITAIARLFGGQGTMNVNSWSPDSRRFAFVRYELVDQSPGQADGAATAKAELPAPWRHQDIGDVAVPGTAEHDGDGTFTMTGTLDVWGVADGCHFAYQPLDGDGTITARVLGVEYTNNHAKGGVMIRGSLEAGSPHATMVVTAVDGTQFLRRKEAGGVSISTGPKHDRGQFPYWVKLVRKGDEFQAHESADGRDWVLVGTDTVPLGRRAYLGLVASSHQKTVANTVKLDRVTVSHDR